MQHRACKWTTSYVEPQCRGISILYELMRQFQKSNALWLCNCCNLARIVHTQLPNTLQDMQAEDVLEQEAQDAMEIADSDTRQKALRDVVTVCHFKAVKQPEAQLLIRFRGVSYLYKLIVAHENICLQRFLQDASFQAYIEELQTVYENILDSQLQGFPNWTYCVPAFNCIGSCLWGLWDWNSQSLSLLPIAPQHFKPGSWYRRLLQDHQYKTI